MRPAVGLLLFYKEKSEENENMKNYKIAVAGTGYVGLSLSVLLAQHNQVMAVDIVQAKVDMINNHKSPIQDDYIEKYLAEKELNLTATLDAKAAYRAMKKLRAAPTEEHLWEVVLMYQKVRFKTYSGLPFSYEIRKGRSGEYTKELWIDRRENSKSLAWSSVVLALGNVKEIGAVVDRPKALGDIRGVTYIYGMFYRFGLIDVPDDAKCKMNKCRCVSKG